MLRVAIKLEIEGFLNTSPLLGHQPTGRREMGFCNEVDGEKWRGKEKWKKYIIKLILITWFSIHELQLLLVMLYVLFYM